MKSTKKGGMRPVLVCSVSLLAERTCSPPNANTDGEATNAVFIGEDDRDGSGDSVTSCRLLLHETARLRRGSGARTGLLKGVDGVKFSCKGVPLLSELVLEGHMFAGVRRPADEEFGEDKGVWRTSRRPGA